MSSTISTLDPQLRTALEAVVEVLTGTAEYRLEPKFDARMRQLGENKEACSEEEREEYMAWAEFCTKRTLEKLSALHAIKLLHEALPDVVEMPKLLEEL